MRSKAHFKSHPLHPILVAFPIAFFTGTLLAHAAGWLLDMGGLLIASYWLNAGGIAFALLAAVPGIIDFIYTVPPESSAKKRGAKHGITNIIMVLVFVVAFIYRRTDDVNNYILISIELAGVILLSIAGWMGGTLVYRNQIGVDQRYANAGKWNEESFDSDSGRIEVAHASELKVNAMKLLHCKDKRIVLARTEDQFVAFDDRCTHKGGSLAGGSMMCGIVQCPWHGSQFSVQKGKVIAGPAKEDIRTYTVMENNGKIFLLLD
jgi:nitrite reductase/ring-hydroxylating ferredoxin subunit/uncharacterized membrane protein